LRILDAHLAVGAFEGSLKKEVVVRQRVRGLIDAEYAAGISTLKKAELLITKRGHKGGSGLTEKGRELAQTRERIAGN
jgi:hypothetical protein